MKAKEAKALLNRASEKLRVSLDAVVDAKANVEVVEAEAGEIYLIDGKPALFKAGAEVFPTLLFTEIAAHVPSVVVDMGAVRHVCNGADIMAPGIVRIEGEFSKGAVVLVTDVKHGKPLAIGEILYDAAEARTVKQGAVVKSVHYVSDKTWNLAKTLNV